MTIKQAILFCLIQLLIANALLISLCPLNELIGSLNKNVANSIELEKIETSLDINSNDNALAETEYLSNCELYLYLTRYLIDIENKIELLSNRTYSPELINQANELRLEIKCQLASISLAIEQQSFNKSSNLFH